jgi:adenylate cyclase
VTGQLVDTLTGNHIWAERYDRVLEDIFKLQEELTQAIVGAIAPEIDSTEQSKATRRLPSNLTAYEITLRSRAHALEGFDKADVELMNQSIREAREALTIDPNSVLALLALVRAHGNTLNLQLTADREQVLQEATRAIARAIELDPTDPFGYALRGFLVLQGRLVDRYPAALADVRRAHEMNPNDPTILRYLGALEAGSGEPERGIEHLHQALRLSPRQSRSHEIHQLLAFACYIAKRYDEGIAWALRAIHDMPTFAITHLNFITCLVGAGEIDKARAAFVVGQELAPALFKSILEMGGTSIRPEDRRRTQIFLRIAAGLEDPSAAEPLR